MLYTEEQLKKYSIYQLRFLARHIGVRSPTTKKREELIEKILAIQNGEEQPYYAPNNKGRPAKGCFMPLENSESAIVYGVEGDMDGDVVFKKRIAEYEGDKVARVSGFVLESNYQYFLISFDNPMTVERVAFLSKEFADINGIREGDKLVCEAKYDSDLEMLVAQKVITMDDCEFEVAKRPFFEEKATQFIKRGVDFEGEFPVVEEIEKIAPLCYGDRGLIVGNKRSRLYSIVLPVVTSVSSPAKIVLLALNETPERIDEMKKAGTDKFQLFYSTFSDAPSRQFYVLKMAINYVKRLAERGEDVILLITDLADVYQGNLGNEAIYSIKSFFAMARNFADCGSCTVIGGCSPEFFAEHNDFDNFMDFLWVEEHTQLSKEKTVRHDK